MQGKFKQVLYRVMIPTMQSETICCVDRHQDVRLCIFFMVTRPPSLYPLPRSEIF